jgi:hypothetical protein
MNTGHHSTEIGRFLLSFSPQTLRLQTKQREKQWMTLKVPKSVRLFFLCVWAATMSAAQQISAPAPQPGAIIGTVLDLNGDVVPNASVTLEAPAPTDTQHVATQDNGFFRFDGVAPAIPHRIIVGAEGFTSWTSNEIILEPGQYFILTDVNLRIETVQVAITVVPPEQLAIEQVKAEEKQRVAGIIPNFYAVYDRNPVPLSPKLKFHLAFRAATDPVTTAGFVFNAAIFQLADYPSYRQGAKGYGERLGATFAGGYTNILVGSALLPSLLHQDPRYFYQGTGTTKSRLLHALSFPILTRGDDGRREINFSSMGGDLASGAIANAYYPASDRGPHLVVRSALIGVAGRMVEGLMQEFVLPKFTSRHKTPDP